MNFDLKKICNFIHEIQKERGLIAFYLSKPTKRSLERLKRQFCVVDELVKNVSLKNRSDSRIRTLSDSMSSLPARRKLVIAKKTDVFETIFFYSRNIAAKAIELVEEIAVFDQKNDPIKVSAFINFLKWKEGVGFERAVGTKFIEESNRSKSLDIKEKLGYIISEQRAYERMFLSLADSSVKDSINIILKSDETFKRVEKINKLILKGAFSKGVKSITSEEWFEIFTTKIDLLHKVGDEIIAHLNFSRKSRIQEKKYSDHGKNSLETSVLARLDKIKKTKLFSGIDEQFLYEILKFARVIEYKKRGKIFLQGDSASRFYLLLNGFVKITKDRENGEDTIMQIVGRGQEILETSALSNSGQFTATAEVVDSAELLSFPTSTIREKLKENNDFALNMLLLVANYSENIASQFGHVVTKDVVERVGKFFLKLYLEGPGLKKEFDLPYNKFLIAKYLGMQPETFSRTLSKLRKLGIYIEKNVVNLSDFYTLCKFCDSDAYSVCSSAGSDRCLSKNTWKV